ncbi:MAG: A24 family peptidase [Anaerolineaceae bacterium]|nr:A24 family peptidase [Anaerolineaceae bacterium]
MRFFLIFPLALFGYLFAVIVNYLSDTLPSSHTELNPKCPNCEHPRKLRDYLTLSVCEGCKKPFSRRHKIVMLFLPALEILLVVRNHPRMNLILSAIMIAYFVLVFVIDFEHRLILHITSAFGLILGAIIGTVRYGFLNMVFGALAGFGIMYLLYLLGFVFIKFLNRKREEPIDDVALGFGDVTLSTVLGAMLGWPGIIGGLFFAILLGGLISGLVLIIGYLNKEQKHLYALPYGPFLLLSALVLLFT